MATITKTRWVTWEAMTKGAEAEEKQWQREEAVTERQCKKDETAAAQVIRAAEIEQLSRSERRL